MAMPSINGMQQYSTSTNLVDGRLRWHHAHRAGLAYELHRHAQTRCALNQLRLSLIKELLHRKERMQLRYR